MRPKTIKPGTRIKIYGKEWIVCRWQSGAATDQIGISVRPVSKKTPRALAIGSPDPKAWSRDRMNKTHRKGKKKAKKAVS